MEINFSSNQIEINQKVITDLDLFVLEFISILKKHVKYVIISGYLPIFFGRTRGTEDVDVFIKNIDKNSFSVFYHEMIEKEWYFLNPEDETGLFEMLNEKLSIRAAKKDTLFPNIELKYTKDEIDNYTMNNRINIIINKKYDFYFSPIEIEIPYKLYLGSEKDIEDAMYLWELFKDKIDKELINKFCKRLDVSGEPYGIIV